MKSVPSYGLLSTTFIYLIEALYTLNSPPVVSFNTSMMTCRSEELRLGCDIRERIWLKEQKRHLACLSV